MFKQVFKRYIRKHFSAQDTRRYPLMHDGEMMGCIETVTYCQGQAIIEGWAHAPDVLVATTQIQIKTSPNLLRSDVPSPQTSRTLSHPGFKVAVPSDFAPVTLGFLHNGDHINVSANGILRETHWHKKVALFPKFVMAVARSTPDVFTWRFNKDANTKQQAKARIKKRLGLNIHPIVLGHPMDPALFAPVDVPVQEHDEITIVLPVYNAFELLQECLARVVKHTTVPWHLIVVEDCSPDPAVRPWLREWATAQNQASPARVTLLENQENLGFIKSVNKALDQAIPRKNHVVLLNSDALVPEGWAARLVAPFEADANIASVTPMSNDAEIFTAPLICNRIDLEPGEGDQIDQIAMQFAPMIEMADAPTGVGFCMAMNIKYLSDFPQLDTVFGRGYGEEVDWCQKVRAQGGRHVGLPNLFVEHRGGQSFGSAEKLKLVQANNAIISRRYTDYDQEVQRFIQDDPMSTARIALAIAWAGARAQTTGCAVPVYVAHSMGGGAERYVAHRIQNDIADQGPDGLPVAIVLRTGGAFRWCLEIHTKEGEIHGATHDFDLIQKILAPLPQIHLIYSNCVGDVDPIEIPDNMLSLIKSDQDTLTVLMHDFYPLSPSYTLLNDRGEFTGVPTPGDKDASHRTERPNGDVVTLTEWRAAWGRLISAADHIETFSQDSANHLCTAYPDATPTVKPHSLPFVPQSAPTPSPSDPLVIGVLGNIGPHKGAKILAGIAKNVDPKGLVVIGNVDPSYNLGSNATVHGDFDPRAITTLAQHYGITAWLIPSIWPETFSYTTHECLATGLPVWSFDLGAQAETISAATAAGAPGGCLPLDMTTTPRRIIKQLRNADK